MRERVVMFGNKAVPVAEDVVLEVPDEEPMVGDDLRLMLRAALGERISGPREALRRHGSRAPDLEEVEP